MISSNEVRQNSAERATRRQLLEKVAGARSGKALEALGTAVDAFCSPGGLQKVVPKTGAVTFGELAKEWTSGKLHAKHPNHVELKRTSDLDALRLGKWVYPVVEHVALTAFTEEHADAVMARIPASKSKSTQRHVAQLMTKVLNLAVRPCKHIDRSPLPPRYLPPLGRRIAFTYLFPDEDRVLLACEAIPLVERLFYGFLAREGMRSEEAQALTWAHVDLKRGSVRVDFNKTDSARVWAMGAGVVRALTAWKKMQPDAETSDRIFRDLEKPYHMAKTFRARLKQAGLSRPELFEKNEARRPIRIHDLRATFITVNLANDKTEAWISTRTAHTTSAMINRYRRTATTHEELNQGDLTPLDQALSLPEDCPTGGSSGPISGDSEGENPEKTTVSAETRSAVSAFDSSYEGSNPSVGTSVLSRSGVARETSARHVESISDDRFNQAEAEAEQESCGDRGLRRMRDLRPNRYGFAGHPSTRDANLVSSRNACIMHCGD
jgi:integrase